MPGFEGKLCENNTDECANNPCQHNGHCTDLINDFKCDCTGTGFEGKLCEININECLSQPCSEAAMYCEDLVLNYTCHCFPGFTGRTCEIDIKECEENPCRNGVCYEKSNQSLYNYYNLSSPFYPEVFNYSKASGYICQCSPGFTGHNCETNIDECALEGCMNNGTCYDAIAEYRCSCPQGFTGKFMRSKNGKFVY